MFSSLNLLTYVLTILGYSLEKMIAIRGVQTDVPLFEGSFPEYVLNEIWKRSLKYPQRHAFVS